MPDPITFAPAPHDEASRFIREKPAVARQVFDQMLPELQARAFVISGIENLKTAQTVRDLIAQVPEGADWDTTKRAVTDLLADLGDNATKRAETLLRTHVFQAYAAAEHRALTEPDNLEVFPFWQYKTMGDDRVRDSHAALDGLILPANDPFWKTHFPPWEWGCRCQVIPMTREQVEGIKRKESSLPPEKQSVIDHSQPARLDRLRAGTLDRQLPATDPRGPDVGLAQLGQSRTWDVMSDAERGKPGALQWDPGTLNLDVSDLKSKYDPDLWAAFETSMRTHQIAELGTSAWDWLSAETGTEQSIAGRTLTEALKELHITGKETVTADDMRRLLDDMKEDQPVRAESLIGGFTGADKDGILSQREITRHVQNVLDFVPREKARVLAGFKILVTDDLSANVRAEWKEKANVLLLNRRYIKEHPHEFAATVVHEIMHPLRSRTDPAYKAAIRDLFKERTVNDRLEFIPDPDGKSEGMWLKRDRWIDPSAGRIYKQEMDSPWGRELPSVYGEYLLTMPDSVLSRLWSDPDQGPILRLVASFFYEEGQ